MTKYQARLVGQSLATRVAYALVRGLLLLLSKVWFRASVSGREHLPRTGAYIIAPVHRSNIDTPLSVAMKRGVPIVPVGIGGSERVMRKGSKMIWPHKCHVTIGQPIAVARSEGKLDRTKMADTTAELARRLQIVFDDARRRAGEAG
ncbi:MAG: hypothetical protein EBX76_02500 [Acidimicrobiia bacterium]|nr:hypothetical protein [Acidimicrobiia bacterium]